MLPQKYAIQIKSVEIGTLFPVTLLIPEFENGYSLDYMQERLKDKKYLALVAYAEDQPAGFKIGYELEDSFYSWYGGVVPAFRKHGVATLLADYQEDWLAEKGVHKITMKTLNRNRSMLHFCIKRGFLFTKVEEYEDVLDNRIYLTKNILKG